MLFLNLKYRFLRIIERLDLGYLGRRIWHFGFKFRIRYTGGDEFASSEHVEIDGEEGEIRLFSIMRNEALRLPYFIEYYKELGVDRFFFLDNDSSDDSASIVKSLDNAHLFKTKGPYRDHWYWMEYLLDTYGKNHWCLVVDIDELVHYPNRANLSLRDLSTYFDKRGETAVRFVLLDMYSTEKLTDTDYIAGQNPLEIVSYFDKSFSSMLFSFLDRNTSKYFTSVIFTGGMRDRVFGRSTPPSILSKVSFFKCLPGVYLVQGMHAINNATLSDLQGVVFHTKFLSDFIPEVKEECEREQHYGGAFYYKIFNKRLRENPNLTFHYQGSVKFRDSQQLIDLGIMQTTMEFHSYASDVTREKQGE